MGVFDPTGSALEQRWIVQRLEERWPILALNLSRYLIRLTHAGLRPSFASTSRPVARNSGRRRLYRRLGRTSRRIWAGVNVDGTLKRRREVLAAAIVCDGAWPVRGYSTENPCSSTGIQAPMSLIS